MRVYSVLESNVWNDVAHFVLSLNIWVMWKIINSNRFVNIDTVSNHHFINKANQIWINFDTVILRSRLSIRAVLKYKSKEIKILFFGFTFLSYRRLWPKDKVDHLKYSNTCFSRMLQCRLLNQYYNLSDFICSWSAL